MTTAFARCSPKEQSEGRVAPGRPRGKYYICRSDRNSWECRRGMVAIQQAGRRACCLRPSKANGGKPATRAAGIQSPAQGHSRTDARQAVPSKVILLHHKLVNIRERRIYDMNHSNCQRICDLMDSHDSASLDMSTLFLMLENRDRHTSEHCKRVRALSIDLGRSMALEESTINILDCAALLHDLGKITIPQNILYKPATLDDREWKKMRTHSAIGAELIASRNFPLAKEVAKAVRHHHEHIDGSGYPDGLKGGQIPLLARIISVADSYDALTSRRAYHGIITHDQALGIMIKESGKKLDPDLVTIFINRVIPIIAGGKLDNVQRSLRQWHP